MFDLLILLEEIQNGIGNKCDVFVSPRHGGLLFQVDWIRNGQRIRFQHVVSKMELNAVAPELIANYLIRRASDEYARKLIETGET
jgi:hypothetical protein